MYKLARTASELIADGGLWKLLSVSFTLRQQASAKVVVNGLLSLKPAKQRVDRKQLETCLNYM